MLKNPSPKPNRDVYIITKSPPEQYSKSKTKIPDLGEEINPLSNNKSAIIGFGILGTSNGKHKDELFIRGPHNDLDE